MSGDMHGWVSAVVYTLLVLCTMICYAVNPAQDCLSFESTYHLDRACHCVVYQSYGRSQGTFTSPNFPQIYPSNVNCILYTFVGDLDEIVELTFLEFDLSVPITNKCTDFLRFFNDLERPEVNERVDWKYELCGNISMIQKNHYSANRSFILEFHTDSLQGNNTGFRGRFRFLDKAQFAMVGGKRRFGRDCTYDFYSKDSDKSKSGRFFSPGYPQNYLPDTECQYVFYALSNERIKITFQNIQLESIDGSCSDSPDTIIVRDGRDSSKPVIAQYCNTLNSEQIISSGNYLYVEFNVDGKKQRQGFAAEYTFLPMDHLDIGRPSMDSTARPDGGGGGSGGGRHTGRNTVNPGFDRGGGGASYWNHQPTPPTITDSATDCSYEFFSTQAKNGTFTSPGYPQPYPASTECRYRFQGNGKERVQLKFDSVDLHYPNFNDMADIGDIFCEDVDSIVVKITIGTEPKELGIYCESKTPPDLMSNNNQMEVFFTSHRDNRVHRGFTARYEFVTDFGIKTGVPAADLVCGFNYSSQQHPNGTFISPNHPGLYPRNTECHYLFYGLPNEQIHVEFQVFDVEGITPGCFEDTQSDYIEFSNFNVGLVDRKMKRICGTPETGSGHPESISSDGNFFRVTFKSNSIYDATGFSATYQFRKEDGSAGDALPRNKMDSAAPHPHKQSSSSLYILLTALLCVVIQLLIQR